MEIFKASAMEQFLITYFLQTGIGWAMLGGVCAAAMGAIGSGKGIRIASEQAAGALSEKPEIFGKLLVIIALPGTQGFYAFITLVFIAFRINLVNAGTTPETAVAVSPIIGFALMCVGIGVGCVEWRTAVAQGETSAAAVNLVAKQPDESGRAILLPALVETYALLGLLAGILMTFLLTKPMMFANPALNIVK